MSRAVDRPDASRSGNPLILLLLAAGVMLRLLWLAHWGRGDGVRRRWRSDPGRVDPGPRRPVRQCLLARFRPDRAPAARVAGGRRGRLPDVPARGSGRLAAAARMVARAGAGRLPADAPSVHSNRPPPARTRLGFGGPSSCCCSLPCSRARRRSPFATGMARRRSASRRWRSLRRWRWSVIER